MITRIYSVQIHAELQAEFEPLFKTLARQSVEGRAGCLAVTVGMPAPATPYDYAMISQWQDAQSLTDFIGPDWTQAHIPPGMEKFVKDCWLQHYEHD